jgi:hypothetical protein
VDFPDLRATLDLAVMEASEALGAWSGPADAWFLDGFAPARNPEMWSDSLMALVARRSAPGARAATYTVAGQVRRGLAAAGFEVERQPGFGRKRERLEARLAGAAAEGPRDSSTPSGQAPAPRATPPPWSCRVSTPAWDRRPSCTRPPSPARPRSMTRFPARSSPAARFSSKARRGTAPGSPPWPPAPCSSRAHWPPCRPRRPPGA